MRCLLIAVLAFHSALIVDVQQNSETTLAVQIGDVIYMAELSQVAFKCEEVREGKRVQAEVKNGKLTVKFENGKKARGPIYWVQRSRVHPLP